jgi:hypothetical protein
MRLSTTATALALAGALGLMLPGPAAAQHRGSRQDEGHGYRHAPPRGDSHWRQDPRHRGYDHRAPRYDHRHAYAPRYRPGYRDQRYYRYDRHRHYGPCGPRYRCYGLPYYAPRYYGPGYVAPPGYYAPGYSYAPGFGLHLHGSHGGVQVGAPGFGLYFNW